MEIDPQLIAGLAAVIALAAVVVAVIALLGQRKVRRAYQTFSRGSKDDVLTLIERHIDEVRGLRDDVGTVAVDVRELRELLRSAASRIGTVRYDAFDDMGGRLSFSTAILDEHGDGVVITSINGRAETRTYAKTITGGSSRHNLSEEELAAIQRAEQLVGRTGGRPDEPERARDRRRVRRVADAS